MSLLSAPCLPLTSASGVHAAQHWVTNPYLLMGLVTGPFYGWLGMRWRTRKWWVSGCLAAGAPLFEPLAVATCNRLHLHWAALPSTAAAEPANIGAVEIGVGAALALFFAVSAVATRQLHGHNGGQ